MQGAVHQFSWLWLVVALLMASACAVIRPWARREQFSTHFRHAQINHVPKVDIDHADVVEKTSLLGEEC
jgi:hypothetical protein